MDDNKSIYIWYCAAILVATFSFYYGLGNYPLLNNNEGLYSTIGKYMLEKHDFIIPHLNCLPYLEKPPLLYWLLAISFKSLGFTAFAARFVTATSALLICVTILAFGHYLQKQKIAILTTIMFASSVFISVIARMVFFDMLLTLFVTIALLALFSWQKKSNKNCLRIAYCALAFGVLTKGLIALVIVCGAFGIYLLLTKNWHLIKKLFDPIAILLFLLIALPWHIAASIQDHNFFSHYIINEQFLRFLNLREPHDYYTGSFFYYLPRILIYILPWSLLLPLLVRKKCPKENRELQIFLWCWIIVPLLFFSISVAKANYYMIVSMPALLMLLSLRFVELIEENRYKLLSSYIAIILLVTSIGIYIFAFVAQKDISIITPLLPKILAFSIYGVAATFLILLFYHKPIFAFSALAACIIPVTSIGISGIELLSDKFSATKTAAVLAEIAPNHPVYFYQDFEKYSSLAFYTNQCHKIIDSQSNDLYYAEHQPEYKEWFLSFAQFLKDAPKQQPIIVLNQTKLGEFLRLTKPINFKITSAPNDLVILSTMK